MQVIENQMVKYREPEPKVAGYCEQCGETIYEGHEHGEYDGALFCDESCFHVWIGFEVVD